MSRYGARAIGGDLLDKAPFVRSPQRGLASMHAVWSLWTKPLGRYGSVWPSLVHYLFSWVLSVELARQHFSKTLLVTDDAGASLLLDGIGLQFDQVSLELNSLNVTGQTPESKWALDSGADLPETWRVVEMM